MARAQMSEIAQTGAWTQHRGGNLHCVIVTLVLDKNVKQYWKPFFVHRVSETCVIAAQIGCIECPVISPPLLLPNPMSRAIEKWFNRVAVLRFVHNNAVYG